MDKGVFALVFGILVLITLVIFAYSVDNNMQGMVVHEDCHAKSVNGAWQYCSKECLCSHGEGDCDSNLDCKLGLKCANNMGPDFDLNSWVDVCVDYSYYISHKERLFKG